MKIFGKLQQQNYEKKKEQEKKLSQNTTKKKETNIHSMQRKKYQESDSRKMREFSSSGEGDGRAKICSEKPVGKSRSVPLFLLKPCHSSGRAAQFHPHTSDRFGLLPTALSLPTQMDKTNFHRAITASHSFVQFWPKLLVSVRSNY